MNKARKDKIDMYGQGASPLVKQIIELILEQMDKLEQDQPLAPELDLADQFGVSRKTIRTAMLYIHAWWRNTNFSSAARSPFLARSMSSISSRN